MSLLVEEICGKKIESIRVEAATNDIDVRFSGGYWVRAFVSDPTDDEAWYFRDCHSDVVVTASPTGLRLEKLSRASHERSPTIARVNRKKMKPKPGDKVILKGLPPGLTGDLPKDEQHAIFARVGKPIMLMGYDRAGRAELEFMAPDDSIHTLYVDPKFIRLW
ncbi:MAG: hypothetical protein WB621_07425 [Candidatus Acidiferrales bacterium]